MGGKDNTLEHRAKYLFNKIFKGDFYLIVILILALILRLYYFVITQNQALWWDALVYGALAKNIATGFQWSHLPVLAGEIVIRPKFLSVLWAAILKAGLGELSAKFFLEIVPSVLSVFVVYLIGRKMYDRRIALFASFILAISWIHLFYSVRMLTSIPALFFLLISIFFFIKWDKESKTSYFSLSIFFLSLSILMRFPFGLVGFVYLAYLVLVQRTSFIKKKSFWIGGIIGIIPLIIFFILNLVYQGSFFPAVSVYATSAGEKSSFAFSTLNFIPHIFRTPLLALFILGCLFALSRVLIGYDLISKDNKLRHDLFLIILLVFTLAFFIFIIKASEDRYLFIAELSFLILASKGLFDSLDLIKGYLPNEHIKSITTIVIILFIGFGMYTNLTFGDAMIKSKSSSFQDIKQAYLWLNQNAPPNSEVIGETSTPYVIYYTSLNPIDFPAKEIPPNYTLEGDYLVWTAYHWHQDYLKDYMAELVSSGKVEPIHVKFFDAQNTQPSVIIFKIN